MKTTSTSPARRCGTPSEVGAEVKWAQDNVKSFTALQAEENSTSGLFADAYNSGIFKTTIAEGNKEIEKNEAKYLEDTLRWAATCRSQ